jgi:hypothetical protein
MTSKKSLLELQHFKIFRCECALKLSMLSAFRLRRGDEHDAFPHSNLIRHLPRFVSGGGVNTPATPESRRGNLCSATVGELGVRTFDHSELRGLNRM